MSGSQKFISRNRAPRVQIEYDVELYGAEKKVQLPFVMGVLSDLSGKSEQPPVGDRKFLEIDVDNFDDRMKAMAPRAQFTVPNTLSGEGNLAVDLTFEKMSDFSPEAIAAKVDTLAPLLEARRQLSDLMAYMDGKSGAETLIETLLTSPGMLRALAGGQGEGADMDAALETLKSALPEVAEETDTTDATLSSLASAAPEDTPAGPDADDILGGIERVETPEPTDDHGAALDALRAAPVAEGAPEDNSSDVLAAMERVETAEEEDRSADVLAALDRVEDVAEEDRTGDILGSLEAPEEAPEEDTTGDILSGIEKVEDTESEDESANVLAAMERVETVEEDDRSADVLAALDRVEEVAEQDHTGDILSSLESPEEAPEEDKADDILSGIETVEDTEPENDSANVLAAMERVEAVEEDDRSAHVLAALDRVEEVAEEDRTGDILGSLEAPEDGPVEDKADDILSGIEKVEDTEPENDSADVLAAMERVEEVAEKDNTVEDSAPEEDSSDVLAAMERVETVEEEDSDLDDLLAGLETPKDTADDAPDVGGILSGIEPAQTEEVADDTAAVLGSLDSPAPDAQEEQSVGDVLGGLEAPEEEGGEDDTADILADLEPVEEAGEETDLDALLNDLDSPEPETGTDAGDVLAALDPVEDTPETETADDVLAGLEATEVAEEADDLDALLSGLDTPEEAGGEPDAPLEESGDSDPEVGFDATDQTGSPEEPDDAGDDLDALLGELDDAPAIDPEDDDQAAALTDPDDVDGTAKHEDADDLDALLSGLEDDMPSEEPEEEDDDLDALLADLEGGDDADVVATHEAESADGDDDLDALLAGLDDDDAPQAEAPGDTDTDDEDLDALLAGFDDDPVAEEPEAEPEPDDDDLDALLADLDGADDDTGDEGSDDADTEDDDLDALLADLEASDDEEDEASEEDGDDDLDALLAGLEADDDAPETESDDDLDALMADLGDDDGGEAAVGAAPDTPAPVPQSPFGRISAPRPERGTLNRSKFRIALFGDFTGRAARGLRETGSALAARPPILLDVDTVEEVIEGFATTLTLPIGKDGAGIEVKLGEFDDLHPDELYENIPIFDELSGLRRQLGTGSMADKAKERLKAWGEAHGTPVRLPKRSASTSVPANLKLSDFQALIGDTSNTLSSGGPIDDLIARIVGPHIVKAPDAGTEAMLAAVDEALSSAMRLVLHHPDFQAIEAQWRSLDLLARRIETDSSLEIVLYDVSAEELAIDLAAQEDLAESGLFDLLTGVLDPEEGAGGFSALFGLYTFEETPPHAELLARIGQVARHVDAPFFTAMTPGFLDVAKEDRHRLTAETWDKLRTTPEAAYLGLASPRVLLRLPYGKKSDPCYAFDFEEFTPQEGLSGMLWANPAVVVAILLAATYKKDGKAMEPGSVMSLGDMPFHYVTDRYGDQVALPCTERNLTADPVQHTLARGFMPLVSVKGRNEVRLGSFRSLAGTPIAGSWADGPAPGAAPPDADIQMDIAVDPDGPSEDEDLDTEATETDGTGDDDLDALLAGFDDDDDSTGDGEDADEMDPELAALLDGL